MAPGNEATARRAVAGMDKGLRRIGDIISQVLLLGEHGRPVLHRASPAQIVNEAVETFRHDRGFSDDIELRLEAVNDLWIRTNAVTIETVICRLLLNAAEAAGRVPGNKPRIRVVATPSGHGDSRRVVIRIEDNGPGVDATVAESVFDPFISVKAEVGSGLGLPLARHAVELLGGALTLENIPGGAVATVTLPVFLDSPPPFAVKG